MEEIQKATKERKKNKFLRTLQTTFTLKRLITGGISIALVVTVYLIATSSLFDIKDIEITGGSKQLSYVNPTDVTDTLTGIIESNYFQVDIENISDKIQDKSTYIKSALVYKTFPSTISIQITEREPMFVLASQTKCILLDEVGFVLSISEGEGCSGNIGYTVLPLIRAELPNHTFTEGQESSFLITSEISDIVKLLAHFGYTGNILDLTDNVLLVSDEAAHQFIFSMSQDIETQLARFVAISKAIEDEVVGFRSLDLRYKKPVLVPTD